MGLYNNFHITCPSCQDLIEVQSKAGPDECKTYYDHKDIPEEVAEDIDNEEISCNSCNWYGCIIARTIMKPVTQIGLVSS